MLLLQCCCALTSTYFQPLRSEWLHVDDVVLIRKERV
jgi:hypothetical protein